MRTIEKHGAKKYLKDVGYVHINTYISIKVLYPITYVTKGEYLMVERKGNQNVVTGRLVMQHALGVISKFYRGTGLRLAGFVIIMV